MARSQNSKKNQSPQKFQQQAAEWRHKAVIDHYLAGDGSPAECWMMVYPNSDKASAPASASRLFNSEWAMQYVTEQEVALAKARSITREKLVIEYQHIAQHAIGLEVPQLSAAKSCIDAIAKMCGLSEPDQIIIKKTDLSEEELDAALAKRLQALQT